MVAVLPDQLLISLGEVALGSDEHITITVHPDVEVAVLKIPEQAQSLERH